MGDELDIHLTRMVDAPRMQVYLAWTVGEYIENWMAPNGYQVLMGDGNLVPGGKWSQTITTDDGSEFRQFGVYKELEEDSLIAFTRQMQDEKGPIGAETLVTVTFTTQGRRTKCELVERPFGSKQERNNQMEYWNQCLDNLEKYVMLID